MRIERINPEHAKHLIEELDRYQKSLYPGESCHMDSIATLQAKNVHFYGAIEGNEIIAIGSVKILENYGELKRIYVPPIHRGKGLAKKIISVLENEVRSQNISIIRLETGPYSTEAISLYKKLGYTERGAFGDYSDDPLSTFMEKHIV
mgnify:CR=1 FL=1